jgi:hypothetical protein
LGDFALTKEPVFGTRPPGQRIPVGFSILKIGASEFAVRSSQLPIRPVVSPFVE